MAPAAQLYLMCIDTELDLKLAEQDAIADGVKIVNHSISWFNTARGDGNGGANSPDADRRRRARPRDPLGERRRQLRARTTGAAPSLPTRPTPTCNDFAPGNTLNRVTIPSGEQACAYLKWDAWPVTSEDFDLVPRAGRATTPRSSPRLHDQSGGPAAPTESLCYTNTGATQTFGLGIVRYSASTLAEVRPVLRRQPRASSSRPPPAAWPTRPRRRPHSRSAPTAGRRARSSPSAPRARRSTAGSSPTCSRRTVSRPRPTEPPVRPAGSRFPRHLGVLAPGCRCRGDPARQDAVAHAGGSRGGARGYVALGRRTRWAEQRFGQRQPQARADLGSRRSAGQQCSAEPRRRSTRGRAPLGREREMEPGRGRGVRLLLVAL